MCKFIKYYLVKNEKNKIAVWGEPYNAEKESKIKRKKRQKYKHLNASSKE